MSEETLRCPNCDAPVEVGELSCPKCGINLRTGESFESKVKRAKSKDLHPEHFRSGLYLTVGIIYAIVVFGGYMYQRRVEGALRERQDVFADFLARTERVERLAAAGRTAEAREVAAAVIEAMRQRDRAIEGEINPRFYGAKEPAWGVKTRRVAEQRLLRNMVKKLERKLSALPSQ